MPVRTTLPLLLLLPLALSAGPAPAAENGLRAPLIASAGRIIGSVELTEIHSGVLVKVEATDLPAGMHGFHFHESAHCEPTSGFKSAGGHHHGDDDQQHGLDVSQGPHAGDMPNQIVGEDGVLRVNVLNTRVSLQGGDAPLLDDNGSALVIHAGTDDYRSQPSGNAGNRLACAEIRAE